MNREQYKLKKKGQPKRKGKLSGSKSKMLKTAQKGKPNTSLRLREVYYAKIEWVRKANFQIERRIRSALNLSTQRFNTLCCIIRLLESFKCFKPSVVKRQHVRGYTGLSFLEYLTEILHRQRSWLGPSVACLT